MSVFSLLMKFVKHDYKVKLKSVAEKLTYKEASRRKEVKLGENTRIQRNGHKRGSYEGKVEHMSLFLLHFWKTWKISKIYCYLLDLTFSTVTLKLAVAHTNVLTFQIVFSSQFISINHKTRGKTRANGMLNVSAFHYTILSLCDCKTIVGDTFWTFVKKYRQQYSLMSNKKQPKGKEEF